MLSAEAWLDIYNTNFGATKRMKKKGRLTLRLAIKLSYIVTTKFRQLCSASKLSPSTPHTTWDGQSRSEPSPFMIQYNPYSKDHQRNVWVQWMRVELGVAPEYAPSHVVVEAGAEKRAADTWSADKWGSTVDRATKSVTCWGPLTAADAGQEYPCHQLKSKIRGWFSRWYVGPS